MNKDYADELARVLADADELAKTPLPEMTKDEIDFLREALFGALTKEELDFVRELANA